MSPSIQTTGESHINEGLNMDVSATHMHTDEATGEVSTKKIDVTTLAREFMVGELIACVVKRFQTQDKAWRALSHEMQSGLLFDVRQDIEDAVRSAVELIASSNRFVYRAMVDNVQFKADGVKATLTLANTIESHDLADRAGQTVLIINEDGRTYLDGPDLITAEADQRPLL